MESIIGTTYYTYLFHDLPDPRVKHWPLLGDPLMVTFITALWMWFVLRAGPQYMSSRKPFKLKYILPIVNILQVIFNIYLVYELAQSRWFYNWDCDACDFSRSPQSMRLANAVYIYLQLKLFDMLDTVFYVLRKKDSQISFLHIYHHITTLSMAWMVSNYTPGGGITVGNIVNSMVHVIMYTYYFISSLGPQYQRYLWWKKYLTTVQLIQFTFLSILTVYGLTAGCFSPMFLGYLCVPFFLIMLVLFLNFYFKNYSKNKGKKYLR